MDYIYSMEDSSAMLGEARDLMEAHRVEISANQDIALDINEEQYLELERKGGLKIFTCRTVEEEELVGYGVFFVQRNIRYDSLQALQDVLYISPTHRGQGGGFITWIDSELEKMKVQVVYHHVKIAHDWGALLERKGYNLIEKVYSRRLD